MGNDDLDYTEKWIAEKRAARRETMGSLSHTPDPSVAINRAPLDRQTSWDLCLVLNKAYEEHDPLVYFRYDLSGEYASAHVGGITYTIFWDSGDDNYCCIGNVLGEKCTYRSRDPLLAFKGAVRRTNEHLAFVQDHILSKL